MTVRSNFSRCLATLLAGAVLFPGLACAQEYPARPVRLVNPNLAGGVSDRMARTIGKAMEPTLGQSIVVENKPGAASVLGVSEVLRAKPDGYFVGQTCLGPVVILPLTGEKMPFNFQEDAIIVGMMGGLDTLIATRADNPVSTIEEMIADAKANPGKVSIGMAQSPANSIPLAYMTSRSGVELTMVSYRGEIQALTDLLGGTLKYAIQSTGLAIPQLQAGKIKAIQVLATKRNPALPNVPSQSDTKVPGFPPNSYCVMFVPKGTPNAIVQKLNRSLNEAAKDKELLAIWSREGLVPYIGGTPAESMDFLKEVSNRWVSVAKEIDFSKHR